MQGLLKACIQFVSCPANCCRRPCICTTLIFSIALVLKHTSSKTELILLGDLPWFSLYHKTIKEIAIILRMLRSDATASQAPLVPQQLNRVDIFSWPGGKTLYTMLLTNDYANLQPKVLVEEEPRSLNGISSSSRLPKEFPIITDCPIRSSISTLSCLSINNKFPIGNCRINVVSTIGRRFLPPPPPATA